MRTRLWRRSRRRRLSTLATDQFLPGTLRNRLLRRLALTSGLASLAPDLLALVTNALALVRLDLTKLADARRHLADRLLIDSANDETTRHPAVGLGWRKDLDIRDLDAGRRRDLDGV